VFWWKTGRLLYVLLGWLVATWLSRNIVATYSMIEPYSHQEVHPIVSAFFVISIIGLFLGSIVFPYIASILNSGFYLMLPEKFQRNINIGILSIVLLITIGLISFCALWYLYRWLPGFLWIPVIVTAVTFILFDGMYLVETNETTIRAVHLLSSAFSMITVAIFVYLLHLKNALDPWNPSPEGWTLNAPIYVPWHFWSTQTPVYYMLFSAISIPILSTILDNAMRRLLSLLFSIFLFSVLSIVSFETKNLFFMLCGTIISVHILAINTLSFSGSYEFE